MYAKDAHASRIYVLFVAFTAKEKMCVLPLLPMKQTQLLYVQIRVRADDSPPRPTEADAQQQQQQLFAFEQ